MEDETNFKKEAENEEDSINLAATKEKITNLFSNFREPKEEVNTEVNYHSQQKEFLRKELNKLEQKEEEFNFTKLKDTVQKIDVRGFINKLKDAGKQKEEKKRETENWSFDFNSVLKFYHKNAKWLMPLVLILAVILLSSYLRMATSSLPITEVWAETIVQDYYQQQITANINKQYPNLPDLNKQKLIAEEFNREMNRDPEEIKGQITETAKQFKTVLQDKNQQTYLIGIDPYFWYSQVRNILNNGHLGDKIVDGKPILSLRDGRFGKEASLQLHPYVGAYFYKFVHFFNQNISLMRVMFIMPVFLIALAIIPAFFLGRKIGGNVGGFFTAAFFAMYVPMLTKTIGGHNDTDPYNALFPLLITWLFIEAYDIDKQKWKWMFSILAGLLTALYSITWGGWMFIFYFLLGAGSILLILNFVINLRKRKYKFKLDLFRESNQRNILTVLLVFLASTGLFVSLLKGANQLVKLFYFDKFFRFHNVMKVGLKSFWPKVITTVAEFEINSYSTLISGMGGKLILILLICGIFFTLMRQKEEKREYLYFILLSFWIIGIFYAYTRGTRFALLMAPAYGLALGSFCSYVYVKGSSWLNQKMDLELKLSRILVLVVLLFLLVPSFMEAKAVGGDTFPLMNDTWYNFLIKIKENSSPEAIITSWWDYGHWFTAIAERRVTFDGGEQGERIHWVGKILSSTEEEEAVGVLRMLNCAQDRAPHKLDEFTNDSLKSLQIINKVILIFDREEARQEYRKLGLTEEQAKVMIEYTHCLDLRENFFIVSGDLFFKSLAWTHYGNWDFQRAEMYFKVRNLPFAEGPKYLMERFSLDEKEAETIYEEIKNAENEKWISPPLQFYSERISCSSINNQEEVNCIFSYDKDQLAFQINLENLNVKINNNPQATPKSVFYLDVSEIKEKVFFNEEDKSFSLLFLSKEDKYFIYLVDRELAESMFTRLLFLNGHGLKCFERFDEQVQYNGEKIVTWKVDWNCQQKNTFFQEELKTETKS